MTDREPVIINGKPRRSVTETIDMLGINKAALMQWVAWCGREGLDWNRYRDDAALLGSAVHARIEAHMIGKPVLRADASDPFTATHDVEADALFDAWLEQWASGREFSDVQCERKLILESCNMHGTCDMVATENGRRVLYDWKTSTKSKAKLEHWVQAAAYLIMLEDAGEKIDDVCIVTIDKKKRKAREERIALTNDGMTAYRELWWLAHGVAEWLDNYGGG